MYSFSLREKNIYEKFSRRNIDANMFTKDCEFSLDFRL